MMSKFEMFQEIHKLSCLSNSKICQIIVDEETWRRLGEEYIAGMCAPDERFSLEKWDKQGNCMIYGILVTRNRRDTKEHIQDKIEYEVKKLIKKIEDYEQRVDSLKEECLCPYFED